MPRIYKGNEVTMKLLVHKCVFGEIGDLKIALYTTNPDNAIEFTDRYTIDGNIATLIVPNYAFGTMEDGLINYVAQGIIDGETFYTNRQSNYFLKTPTDYVPTPMPEEIILEVVERDITENGRYTITPNEGYDGLSKVDVNVNIPEEHILQEKTVQTTNSITSVTPDDGYDGLSKVTVDATGYGVFEYNNGFANGRNSVNILKKKTINIEKNGEQTFYSFDDGVDGYKNVTVNVNVDIPTQKLTDKSISIDKNGDYVYYASEDGVDGYDMVSINVDVPTEGGGSDCNIIEFQEYTLKGETDKINASDYGADGFAIVSIDAIDLCKEKYNEGYEQGKADGGGEGTTYPTIADIYNSDLNAEVTFKATVAGIFQNNTNYYLIVTDHTGAYSLNFRNECPLNVGDECVFTGVNRRNNTTLIRYMQVPTNYEVLSSNNYVVLPAEALSIKDTSEIYSPNEYGNTEIKYMCFEGEIISINVSNGLMKLNTAISSNGTISLRSTKQEWRDNVKVGDVVKVYGFPQETNNYIFPTEMVKIGGEQIELTTLDVDKNGTYEGAFGVVNVNVPTEGGEGGYDVNNAVVLEVTENGMYTSKYSEIEWDEPTTGVYNDGTKFYSYVNLATTVYDTGIPATQDSKLEFWWKSDNSFRINGTVVGAQHFNGYIFKFVEYSKNTYKIEFGNYKIGGLFTHTFNYDMTSKWAHISLSKKDGLIVDGQLICTIDGEKWADNETIPNFWINTSYDEEMGNTADGSFGMIKINDTVIIPTEKGFLNTSTNELLTKVSSGAYEYINLEVPVAEGELMKTIKVNVPMKLNPNKMNVSFGFSSFSELPEGFINWNSVTDMQQMFRECKNLQSLNVESKELKDIGFAFYNCSSLSDLTIDTSNVNSLNTTFFNCKSLPNKFFETLDTSKVTNMNCAFQSTAIETFSLDTSNVINMYGMFQSTSSTLKKVNPINTSKVTNMSYMFYDFSGIFVLEELPEFDCSSVNDMSRMFSYYQDRMPNFTTCGGWKNLSCNWNDNYGLRACANLSLQSCFNILNGLADVTGLGTRTLKVHQNFLDLVGDNISIGVNKGWTITA